MGSKMCMCSFRCGGSTATLVIMRSMEKTGKADEMANTGPGTYPGMAMSAQASEGHLYVMLGLNWLNVYQISTFTYPSEYLLKSLNVWEGPGVS